MSDPKPGTFTHYPTDFERLEVAEAHIKRLTAELAEMTANYTAALSLIDRMQADVEWSRRAGEMT